MKTVLKKMSVIVGVVVLIVAFTEAGDAADWNFYGSSRMDTWWNDQDRNAGNDDEIIWTLRPGSRIGAMIKGESVSGRFEFGAGVGTGVKPRFLYGRWDFGPGQLRVGQDFSPTSIWASNQAYLAYALFNYGGGIWTFRRPCLKLKFGEGSNYHALFGLVQPQTAKPITAGDGDGDNVLPKFEASFGYRIGWFRVRVVGGYQIYKVENSTIGNYDVEAYILGLSGFTYLGPLKTRAVLAYGVNWTNYEVWTTGRSLAFISGARIEDTHSFSIGGSVDYKVSDRISFEGGYGYVQHDGDVAGQQENNAQAYYIQCRIKPAPGVYIIPEIGILDKMENTAGADEGSTTYIGAEWRISF